MEKSCECEKLKERIKALEEELQKIKDNDFWGWNDED